MSHERKGQSPPPTAAERLEELKLEIAARLRPVCQSMPADEFDRMVGKIAAIELKYAYGCRD